MSKQAFEKLMTQLSDDEKKNIYAITAAYGLDFESPEWIPFAVSQHGLLSIQRAIVDLNTAVIDGSNFAIGQAMKALTAAKEAELVKLQAATAASQATVKDAAEKARSAIDSHSATTQAALLENIASSVRNLAETTFSGHAVKIEKVAKSLAASLTLAEGRISQIREVGILQVLGWAMLGGLAGGMIVATIMVWLIRSGHFQ